MALKPGVGRIIQLQKRIKELKEVLEAVAKRLCEDPRGVSVDANRYPQIQVEEECGKCISCRARAVLKKR